VKKLLSIIVAFMLVITVLTFSACSGGESLENGTYRVSRVYIDGESIDQTHARWVVFGYAMYFVVDGNNLTTITRIADTTRETTVEFRIRNGYLERRVDLLDGRQWLRWDGTIAPAFSSTRVENGEIVERYTSPISGEVIQIFYSRVEQG